jgi:hypothetical protein
LQILLGSQIRVYVEFVFPAAYSLFLYNYAFYLDNYANTAYSVFNVLFICSILYFTGIGKQKGGLVSDRLQIAVRFSEVSFAIAQAKTQAILRVLAGALKRAQAGNIIAGAAVDRASQALQRAEMPRQSAKQITAAHTQLKSPGGRKAWR